MPDVPPMCVAIFCGESKPTQLEDYLRPLVEDLKDVLVNGIEIQNAQISIQLRAIIADSPARSFIKG